MQTLKEEPLDCIVSCLLMLHAVIISAYIHDLECIPRRFEFLKKLFMFDFRRVLHLSLFVRFQLGYSSLKLSVLHVDIIHPLEKLLVRQFGIDILLHAIKLSKRIIFARLNL